MKQKLTGLSQRYAKALRKHLKEGRGASLLAAVRLGREAVALGLETLELARMHERALILLNFSDHKNGSIRRAEAFFAETITPVVETHRAAQQSRSQIDKLNVTLNRRTVELATTNRQLRRGVVRRKDMKNAYEISGKRHDKSLEESLQLQKRLRQLTHKVLKAQEDERRIISHELQDEIAQTLLGINVRLLSMKQTAHTDRRLKNEIASTQRLVLKSAKSVRKYARELNIHKKA